MRALDPAFAAHLASGATTLATCWRIARADGAVFGFTDHDRPLLFGGVLYEPETGADGAAFAASADLAVDNTEIEGLLSSERLPADELLCGRFDGAAVEIWRVNWHAPDERALLRRGTIGAVRREGARFVAEIRGLAQALEAPRGRLYQQGCDAVLGDARCGVDLTLFRAEGAVAQRLTEDRFAAEGLGAHPDNWFVHGRLDWLSGRNAGTFSHVKAQEAGGLALWAPPGFAIEAGETFAIHAGCDKRFATCREKFANGENFRGFPFLPGNDAAIAYPLRGERNDGGRRE